MPMQALNGDLIEVKFYTSNDTQQGINVVHYHVTARIGVTVTDQDIASQLSTAVAPKYKDYLSTGTRYRGLRLQIVAPVAQVAVISTLGAGVGVKVEENLPPMVSMLMSVRTATPGRSGRGRTYLPFWNEGDSDVFGRPNAAAKLLASAWATTVYSPFTTTVGADSVVITPIVYSKVQPAARRAVENVIIRDNWATQRRRGFLTGTDTFGPTV